MYMYMYMHNMHMLYATVRERDAIANDAMRRMLCTEHGQHRIESKCSAPESKFSIINSGFSSCALREELALRARPRARRGGAAEAGARGPRRASRVAAQRSTISE